MALPIRISRADRIDPFELERRDLSDVLGRFLGGGWAEDGGRLAPFGVDIREDADHLIVEADLPGFRKEDVDITLENGTLTIDAEKRQEAEPEPAKTAGARGRAGAPQAQQQAAHAAQGRRGNYLLRERRYERFTRSFTLPQNVDEQNVQAKLENGCLTITLSKREESKPRRIGVS